MDFAGTPIEMKNNNYIIHPLRFAMWLFLLTVIMIFGSLTSAYLVNKSFLAEPLIYDLPSILWVNLAVIIFSSVTLQFSVWANKQENYKQAAIGLGMTMILGFVFLYGQYESWDIMTASGLPFVDDTRTDPDNPGRIDNTVSFFYIFTGLHGVHLMAGLIALVFMVFRTLSNSFPVGRRKMAFELTATFWHFLGALWLYLFIFLKYTQT